MTQNETSIMNIEVMAHNVMSFRSFYHADGDICGEVDDMAQKAENALIALAQTMKRYDPDAMGIMTGHNAHNPELVREINKAWTDPDLRGNFGFILGAIVERDSNEADDKLDHFPESFDETMTMASEILENICDDEDLKTILSFVGYTRK